MAISRQEFFLPDGVRLERLPIVLARTGLSRSTIYKKISEGTFPHPVKLGERAVAWDAAAVTAWISDRVAANDPAV